jgi:hypothetical protein
MFPQKSPGDVSRVCWTHAHDRSFAPLRMTSCRAVILSEGSLVDPQAAVALHEAVGCHPERSEGSLVDFWAITGHMRVDRLLYRWVEMEYG